MWRRSEPEATADPEAADACSSDGTPPPPTKVSEVDWTPGWDWLACVLAIHIMVVAPWAAKLGVWLLAVAALTFSHYVRVFRKAERWRFAIVDERAVLFEPPGRDGSRVPARLRGPPWMTERWIVVRTTRRILVLRAGRYDAAVFAALRRALLGGAANG